MSFSPESGPSLPERDTDFHAPETNEAQVPIPSSNDPDGLMAKIARFAHKLPGGGVVLTAVGLAEMMSGGVLAEAANKPTVSSSEAIKQERATNIRNLRSGIETIIPIKFALVSGWGEFEKRPDGSIALKRIGPTATTFGDTYYQTEGYGGQFANKDIAKEIDSDIKKIQTDIDKKCGSRKGLAKHIVTKLYDMVKEIWPKGTKETPQLTVTRYEDKNGKTEQVQKTLPFSWITVQEGTELAMKHNEPLLSDLADIPTKDRTAILNTLINGEVELEMDAAAQVMESGESQ